MWPPGSPLLKEGIIKWLVLFFFVTLNLGGHPIPLTTQAKNKLTLNYEGPSLFFSSLGNLTAIQVEGFFFFFSPLGDLTATKSFFVLVGFFSYLETQQPPRCFRRPGGHHVISSPPHGHQIVSRLPSGHQVISRLFGGHQVLFFTWDLATIKSFFTPACKPSGHQVILKPLNGHRIFFFFFFFAQRPSGHQVVLGNLSATKSFFFSRLET